MAYCQAINPVSVICRVDECKVPVELSASRCLYENIRFVQEFSFKVF